MARPRRRSARAGDKRAAAPPQVIDAAAVPAMRVADLRAALSARGLPMEGVKAQLAQRLAEALAAESPGAAAAPADGAPPERGPVAEAPAHDAQTPLGARKHAELRQMCADRGLKTSGSKATLAERLAEHLGAAGTGEARVSADEEGRGREQVEQQRESEPARDGAQAADEDSGAAATAIALDVSKLKVTELRAALSSRGLDSKGLKAALVVRLREALVKEAGKDAPAPMVESGDDDMGQNEDEDEQPSPDDLTASAQTLTSATGAAYWRRLCPHLSVDGESEGDSAPAATAAAQVDLSDEAAHAIATEILSNGFARVGDMAGADVSLPTGQLPHVSALADGVHAVVDAGWPASFVLMYDEAWAMLRAASAIVERASGGRLSCNLDSLAWRVDAAKGEAGFAPHRDRQPDNAGDFFFEADDFPKYATLWVALTDATPAGGCLYAVPKDADPGYASGDPVVDNTTRGLPMALRRALPSKESLQMIAALPVPAGSAVAFSGRSIHWGSAGYGLHPPPRIAISFGCSDADFEAPYLKGAGGSLASTAEPPPPSVRLALAAAQTLVYHQRFPQDAGMLSLCTEAFNRHADDFDERYATKVRAELVEAVKEAVENAEELGEEVEELLMDRALDGVLEAKGDELLQFRDDFDEMEADGDSEGEESEDYDDYDVCVDSDGEDDEDEEVLRAVSKRTRNALDSLDMMMMDEGDSEDSDGEEDDEAQRAALSRRTRHALDLVDEIMEDEEEGDSDEEDDEDGDDYEEDDEGVGTGHVAIDTNGELSHYSDQDRRSPLAARVPLWHPRQRLYMSKVGRLGRFLSRAHRCHALLDRRKEQAAIFDAIFSQSRR